MKEKDDREEEEREGPEIISYRGAVFDAEALCRVRVNPSQAGRERERGRLRGCERGRDLCEFGES